MWQFDAVRVGNREADAWVAYYRREWRAFLVAAVGMVATGFGMGPVRTLLGAWHVLRANQRWAPHPDNDPDGARRSMRRFYALLARAQGLAIDPARAADLEVTWWRLHREHQRGPEGPDGDPAEAPPAGAEAGAEADALVDALVMLYGYVYAAPPGSLRPAARHRVRAMDLSDAWVRAGCHLDDPLLTQERLALVASYSALLDAAARTRT